MIDIHQALKKAGRLDLSVWRRLTLLVLGAFLLGMSTTFLEVGSVSLFIQKKTFYAAGFDFLIVAICLVFVGSITVKLDRRHGYGGVPLTACLTLLLFGLLKMTAIFPNSVVPANLLFIYKYLMPVVVAMAFWTIAGRFIVLKLSSLKYMGILSASLLGAYWGGVFLSDHGTVDKALMWAVLGFIGLALVMKVLVWLLPQPSETFVRKTGGVQDTSEQKMIDCILMLSFAYTASRGLGDILLYQSLTADNAFAVLSKIWMYCGGLGFLVLALLSHTRFLYTTRWGISVLSLGFFFLAEGAFLGVPKLLYIGFVTAWIFGFLYWVPYLSLLPRPLTLGEGIRLRKLRQMLIEPLAFVLVGAFVLTLPQKLLAPILAVFSLVLLGLMGLSVILYSRLLSRLCKMRSWCGGPLMLVSDKLIRLVQKGAQSDHFQDAVYFLRIMEIAHFPGFKRQLLKALHHPLFEVRLFALDKLDAHGFYHPKVVQAVQQVFKKDKEALVRARALAYLICYEGDYNPQRVYHLYGEYLDDKKLKAGAIMGFLQAGGEWALLAMDGLQKMVLSSQKEENLLALSIIDKVPQKGLVRLVKPLLESPHLDVVRQALLVAGKIGHTQTLSFVFQSLDHPELQDQALQALMMCGKTAFPPLEKMLSNPNVPFTRRRSLILFLGFLPSGEGKQVLLRSLYLPDLKLRKEVFKAILNSKIIWISRTRKKILKQGLALDVNAWHLLNQNILLCQQVPVPALGDSFAFLRRAFDEMRQDLRELILDQLVLLKPSTLVTKAIDILRGPPSQRFISAAGILQDLLPSKLYAQVAPILLFPIAAPEEEKATPMDAAEAKRFLEQLITAPLFPTNRWIEAAALYGLQKVGDTQSEMALNKALHCSSPVVLEAAMELLKHLKTDKKEQEEYLKEHFQRTPKNLNLENYLTQRRKNDYL
ncbi:MAG: HEAT repeat domain-containing protein [Alphaproteobacteria bacterium]